MILDTAIEWQEQNINQISKSQKISFLWVGQPWPIFCEDFGGNRLRYNDTTLYYT